MDNNTYKFYIVRQILLFVGGTKGDRKLGYKENWFLRGFYRNDKNKVQRADGVYKPTLQSYYLLEFLDDQKLPRQPAPNLNETFSQIFGTNTGYKWINTELNSPLFILCKIL